MKIYGTFGNKNVSFMSHFDCNAILMSYEVTNRRNQCFAFHTLVDVVNDEMVEK